MIRDFKTKIQKNRAHIFLLNELNITLFMASYFW